MSARSVADKKKPERPPTPQERSDSVKFLVGGVVLGVVLIQVLQRVLPAESQETLLWHYGRYAAVALFAWVGWSIGLGRGRVVAEHLECLAIAVVMALVLKHFLIEAYKIPTGSMQPTILGNDDSGIFDRVLVNKFAYLLDEPERYDVIVFKYPLDRSKNYIKRLVGLPNEQLMIYNGNIHAAPRQADGGYGPMRIARKPPEVRESVLKTLHPPGGNGAAFSERFEMLAGTQEARGDTVVLSAGARFRYGHGESIRDRYLDGYDPDWGIPAPGYVAEYGTENVSDLALAADVTPLEGAREIRLVIFADGVEHRAVVAVGAGSTSLESGLRPETGDLLLPLVRGSAVVARAEGFHLVPGEQVRVRFLHVDQELILQVDGEDVLAFAYEIAYGGSGDDTVPTYPRPQTSENALEFAVLGGGAVVGNLEVERDIHYLVTGSRDQQLFEVPADALLALGDNTQNSSDGRVWAAQKVILPDGRELLREKRDQGWDTREFIDVYGETWRLRGSERPVVQRVLEDDFRFVPVDLLLGKAVAVFWPVFPHFRWKLIR